MSIPRQQREAVTELAVRSHLTSGRRPELKDLRAVLNKYFSDFPIGTQVKPIDDVDRVAKAWDHNYNLLGNVYNITLLYESILEDINNLYLLSLSSYMRLSILERRRRRLQAQVNDYMHSISNAEGYFYSFTDNFSDTDYVDLTYTSAYVDVETGQASIPQSLALTQTLTYQDVLSAEFFLQETAYGVEEVDASSNAFDGLLNTVWRSIATIPNNTDVTGVLVIKLRRPTIVSAVSVVPHTVSPIKLWVELETDSITETIGSGTLIEYSRDPKNFTANKEVVTDTIRIYMQKNQSDYRDRYIFGAKEIAVTTAFYEPTASIVSQPIALPEHIRDVNAIDVVSIDAEDTIPFGADIKYYISLDDPTASSISDFPWQQVIPLGTEGRFQTVKIGQDVYRTSFNITEFPSLSNDINTIPLNSTSADPSNRNPVSYLLDGYSVYRIAELPDSFEEIVAPTILLEEGIKTLRVYYRDRDTSVTNYDIDYWETKKKGADITDYAFTSSSEFFYGGVLGGGKFVYAETYIDSPSNTEVLLKECKKIDANSKLWAVKVYLNGSLVGDLPVGTDSVVIPWKFLEGFNHIALVIDVPESSASSANPYIGTLDIMLDDELTDFGQVKLADWKYVDYEYFEKNPAVPNIFTIYDNEVVSTTKPSTEFKLSYNKVVEDREDQYIRFRADLTRSKTSVAIAPSINKYTLRFSYE